MFPESPSAYFVLNSLLSEEANNKNCYGWNVILWKNNGRSMLYDVYLAASETKIVKWFHFTLFGINNDI